MKASGIYKIQSKSAPERVYVGSAINLDHRWAVHLFQLRRNVHHSVKLQRHFNKYGEDDLVFITIEPCLPEFLVIREQYYIDLLSPFFNNAKIAGSSLGIKRSEETKQKQRLLKLGKPISEERRNAIIESKKNVVHWNKGNVGYRAGRKESEETCRKHTEANLRLGLIPPSQKGNKRSAQWRQKRNDYFLRRRMNKKTA